MGFSDYLKRVLATILILTVTYALWSTRSILVLAFASIVIAIAIAQPMLFLQKKGLKRGPAVALAIILCFTGVTLISLWVMPTLARAVLGR